MEMKIWKFTLRLEDSVTLWMPQNARVLHVGVQQGGAHLWVLCNPKAPTEERLFRIVGTGHPFDGNGHYLGTVFLHDGALVLHVFEVARIPRTAPSNS